MENEMSQQKMIKAANAALPLVVKRANAEDASTGDAFEIFYFRKVRSRPGVIRVSRVEARKLEKMKEILINKNVDLAAGDKVFTNAVQAAILKEPLEYIVHAKHVGWQKGRRSFVAADMVIGHGSKKFRLEPPLWLNDRQHVPITRKGTVDKWISEVAVPAEYSTRIMCVMSAAFAAPLLGILSWQPFGLNLFGPSKVGKTAALLACTSVIGISKESDLPNWNRTDAAFLEQARVFNDQVLGINEVGLLAGKRGDAYAHLRTVIYRFSEGRDRSRHSSSDVGGTAASSSWRGIFVSTAEHSFNAYAGFSGEKRDEGEFARCLDIPALKKARHTIFDRCPPDINEEDFDSWARFEVIKLRKACERHSGVAMKPYVEHLVQNRETLKQTIAEGVKEFVAGVDIPNDNGALQHAARNMGLVYVGGRLGIEAGLLPWDRKTLLSAVRACFKAAMRELNLHEDPDRIVQRILRKNLNSASVIPQDEVVWNLNGDVKPDGYYKSVKGKLIYVIGSKAFRRWFPNKSQQEAAICWIREGSHLQIGKEKPGKSNAVQNSIGKIEQQPRWPDGENTRSIVFTDPFDRKLPREK
jgi:putative DNA primase/helicase